MKLVIQRVDHAQVSVDSQVVGAITEGLLVLVGVGKHSTVDSACWLAEKTAKLRIFGDGRMEESVTDRGGSVLAISQFTLYGDCRKGTRPSFSHAASPDHGKALYEQYCAALRDRSIHVETGVFGAHMVIDAQCDGPVTIMLERE
ncbi:D-aminoacyl-tRNA deacylase [Stomatohabitans albus]|uniref:D-aminoacyl-tRNA deacylase n=1 Tax=Stomatohabitans albus TaxID=3110766 RepID=UPI00300CE823